MGTSPCCSKHSALNRGAWTATEDAILREYITIHGEGGWRSLPKKAGLKRCGKSCRLRWLNYLHPDIKRGDISPDEEDLIIRLHRLLGNRWSLIAGRLPSRRDNEIKNYWNTHLSKKSLPENESLCKRQTKSKRAPPADDCVLKSTPVKATVVIRPAKSRNKYVDSGNSDHYELLRSTDAAKTVKASKSRCESLVDELMKEDDSRSIDSMMTKKNVESESAGMEINGQYSPFSISNLLDWKIPHSQPCAVYGVKKSQSLLYFNDPSCPVFDLLESRCDFPEDFRIDEVEASPTNELEQAMDNIMPQAKNFTANDEQGNEEMVDNMQQQGDWVDELQCLEKSRLQWLSLLLLESEEDWEESNRKLAVEDPAQSS